MRSSQSSLRRPLTTDDCLLPVPPLHLPAHAHLDEIARHACHFASKNLTSVDNETRLLPTSAPRANANAAQPAGPASHADANDGCQDADDSARAFWELTTRAPVAAYAVSMSTSLLEPLVPEFHFGMSLRAKWPFGGAEPGVKHRFGDRCVPKFHLEPGKLNVGFGHD